MLTLDQQLQPLIDDAPHYGIPPAVMEKAVAPALQDFAEQLQYLEYYLITLPDHSLIMTTLRRSHSAASEEKRVIYVFATAQDARTFQGDAQTLLPVVSLPITHLLFQFFGLQDVDSLIVMENTHHLEKGKEIKRIHLQETIYEYIRRLNTSPSSFYA